MIEKTFDCVGLQRKIRSQIAKEANYDIRKLIEMVKENTKDDNILLKYYSKKAKEKQLTEHR